MAPLCGRCCHWPIRQHVAACIIDQPQGQTPASPSIAFEAVVAIGPVELERDGLRCEHLVVPVERGIGKHDGIAEVARRLLDAASREHCIALPSSPASLLRLVGCGGPDLRSIM